MTKKTDLDLHDLVIKLNTKQNVSNALLVLLIPTLITYHAYEHRQVEQLRLDVQGNRAAMESINTHGSLYTNNRATSHHHDAMMRCHPGFLGGEAKQ